MYNSHPQLVPLNDEAFLQETSHLNHQAFLELAYRTYLKRIYDQAGLESYLFLLCSDNCSRQQVLA